MRQTFPLRGLRDGESVMIAELRAKGPMQARLMDLGFTMGCRVTCLFSSAFGDPRAYLVRGTVIALRQSDAATILCSRGEERP